MADLRTPEIRAAHRSRQTPACRLRPSVRRLMLGTGIGAMLALAACAPRVDVRGNTAEAEDLIHIRQGVTKAEEVRRVLGPPSTVSAFDRKTWFYIGKREETVAFFKPAVTAQQVIELRFDEADRVRSIRTFGIEDAREVARVNRTTRAEGEEPGIFRSMVDLIVRRRTLAGRSRKTYGL